MARAAGHFCPHGNLRYSCPLCRAERNAARAPVERRTYGQALGPGGRIPATPWRMDGALAPHEQDALKAASGRDGVVVMPAPLGLRRVALALLRSLRHDVDGILFLVPAARAVEGWAQALSTLLHVPSDEIDDQGRSVRDWQRLRAVTIWTPETMLRNRPGLRQHAPRLALFVDSPESDAYADLTELLALPFARRIGVSASRIGAWPRASWHGPDALGGVIHRLDVSTAMRQALLADLHHVVEPLSAPDPATRAAAVVAAVEAATRTGRALVWVDDSATGRAVEETAARAGLGARFVPGTATAELAERAARAVREGAARLLVLAADAPEPATGPMDVLVRAADGLGGARAAGQLLAHLAAREGRLRVVDLVPPQPSESSDAAALARRVADTAALAGTSIPAVPWLWRTLAVPMLPMALYGRVAERAPSGWQAVQGLLPDVLDAGLEPAAARAALADAFVAVTFGLAPTSLGPLAPESGDGDALAGPLAQCDGLPALSLFFDDARHAFAALLRGDLAACLGTYAGAPMLHHLVPDVRRLLVATADAVQAGRVPSLDAQDPIATARLLLQRGAAFPRPHAAAGPEPVPIAADPHLERLVQAVEAERALDVAENVEEIQRLSAEERQRQGRTLVGLELVAKRRTDAGVELRYGVPARAGGARPELPYTEATPGTLVDLSMGTEHDPVSRGTVAAVTAHEVRIVVEEDRERRAPGRDARLDIVGNPRVYDLLVRALRSVYGPGGITPASAPDGVRDHLLQRVPAEAPQAVGGQFFNARLNPSQQQAVVHALGAGRLALVHGPPGTGKTTTLAEYVLQEAARGHRVLVTADSNAAVDAVMDACLAAGVVGVRTGPRPSLTRAHLAQFHVDTLSARAPGVDWLGRLPVLFTTHVSSASLPRDLRFDVVVQDEASQATEPASCLSLARAPRLVLAGDHLQLPPVVRSADAERLGLGVSLFERLHAAYGGALGTLLSVQYRMHRDIETWSNAAFYGGRIETAVDPPPLAAAVAAGLLPAAPRAVFVDVAGRESTQRTSKERVAEAEWIAAYVRRLLEAGVRPAQIAVIAAYRAQVRLLRRLLEGSAVDVGTIDAFQGSERDLVVVSLVRGNPRGEVGFVRDPRRLNVAMTRARRHLVVVGESGTLQEAPLLEDLLRALGRMSA